MEQAITPISEQVPAIAAIIVVVVMFLFYSERRDKQFIDFLKDERKERQINTENTVAALQDVSRTVNAVHDDLANLDTYLRASIDQMNRAKARSTTRTRKDDQ
jgi:hypothetical protein